MPTFETRNFDLVNGVSLRELRIAYEAYGNIAPEKDNVILVSHGITSSHYARGEATLDRRKGWWDDVIGPGKVFDTNRYFVVSSNMLGSCYGSTGPSSTDPETGQPYGPRFPDICFEDMVRAQRLMLESMGVRKLVAVAGSSIGGFLVFQWGVTFPDFMRGLIAMDTGPNDLFDTASSISALVEKLSRDPNWNGGDYYHCEGMEKTLTEIRIDTLKSYGIEEKLKDLPDPSASQSILFDTAREWAREFDANSLVTLSKAWGKFNVEEELHRIRAKVFYILADTDEWFPASVGEEVMSRLGNAGVDAKFREISSPHGHFATAEEPEKWTPEVENFLRSLY